MEKAKMIIIAIKYQNNSGDKGAGQAGINARNTAFPLCYLG